MMIIQMCSNPILRYAAFQLYAWPTPNLNSFGNPTAPLNSQILSKRHKLVPSHDLSGPRSVVTTACAVFWRPRPCQPGPTRPEKIYVHFFVSKVASIGPNRPAVTAAR
jgi:hypothetical protein